MPKLTVGDVTASAMTSIADQFREAMKPTTGISELIAEQLKGAGRPPAPLQSNLQISIGLIQRNPYVRRLIKIYDFLKIQKIKLTLKGTRKTYYRFILATPLKKAYV